MWLKPSLMSEADIVRRDVVLEVHEALAASPDFPQRFEGERGRLVFRQGKIGVVRKAREARRLASGGEAVAGGGANPEHAPRRSGRALRLNRDAGDGARKLGAPCRLRAGLARQVDVRIPAARDAEQVGLDRLGVSAVSATMDFDSAPVETRDFASEAHIEPGRLRTLRPSIDHDHSLEPRFLQGARRRIGAVVVREHDRAAARRDAEPAQIDERRPRHHDAGPVVARESDQPLRCAGRQHDLPCADDVGSAAVVRPHQAARPKASRSRQGNCGRNSRRRWSASG